MASLASLNAINFLKEALRKLSGCLHTLNELLPEDGRDKQTIKNIPVAKFIFHSISKGLQCKCNSKADLTREIVAFVRRECFLSTVFLSDLPIPPFSAINL